MQLQVTFLLYTSYFITVNITHKRLKVDNVIHTKLQIVIRTDNDWQKQIKKQITEYKKDFPPIKQSVFLFIILILAYLYPYDHK